MSNQAASTTSIKALVATIAGCTLSSAVNASGFALIEQSVSGMGTAYATGAAHGDDNSAMFFNPATLSLFKGTQASAGAHIVIAQSKFKDGGSTFAAALGGAPLGGGDGGNGGTTGFVPHAAFSHQLDDRTWIGLTINAPFGLATDYDDSWVGRYHALESEVATVNINPAIAYKVNDRLTLGAGLSAQYLKARLSNAIDFGSIDAAVLGGAAGTAGPGSADGVGEVEGDSWGFGFNLGLLFQVTDATRIGMQFRSEIDHDVEGDAKFYGGGQAAVSAVILGGLGQRQFVDTNVSADVKLPATASFSVYHQLNPEWAVVADYTWTGWNTLKELRFDFDSNQADAVTTFKWKNTDRFGVGTIYSPAGSAWAYRVGVAYDESPIPDAQHRTPRLPGEDRLWVALGAGFSPSPNMRFDFGYAHLFVDDPKINKNASIVPLNEDGFRGSLVGSYDASVDIISAQLQYIF
ncbi:MAG: outer membrane protein transport protein [Gammaproteobacteria bacterium]|nr:outer membrane protein transport protein [Gammaproteobacteria bacterium]MCB1922856.1 outer membrane protein transport protein [Gammaproteobacteria bacterium]